MKDLDSYSPFIKSDVYNSSNYAVIFPFERDANRLTSWMQQNWWQSIIISVAYIALIFSTKRSMTARPAFDLQRPLVCWNLLLAVFSLLGALRVTPEFLWATGVRGFHYSICSGRYLQEDGVCGFWTEAFVLSKVFELADTAFIVLRKRPLSFLHWYHHVTVLIYTWHAYKDHTGSGRWFVWMNYWVHAFMYAYYTLAAFRLRPPKFIAMTITAMQLTQMIVGVVIAASVYRIKAAGGACQQTDANLGFSFIVYFTYLLLFCNFFHNAYLKRHERGNKRAPLQNHFDEKRERPRSEMENSEELLANNDCMISNGHYFNSSMEQLKKRS